MTEEPTEAWDLFISHASEDKADFVEPLASALSAFGVRVWYDDYTLRPGDSLSRSIDKGLAKSNYGLVVLSPAFFAKRWTEYELRGLTARELSSGKIILPVWHNVTRDDVLEFSPPLADKVAIRSDALTPTQIAVQIIEAIRPDIFTRILRRIAHYAALQKAETKRIPAAEIKVGPIRHKEFPADLVSRIRLIRACLLGVYPHSMAYWLDGFKRDAHPSKEIAYWEHVAAVYREYVTMAPSLSAEQRQKVFALIFSFFTGPSAEELRQRSEGLPEDALEKLTNLYAHSEPAYDFADDPPMGAVEEPSESTLEMIENADAEHLAGDLPEGLIREIMGQALEPPKKT